MPSPKKTINLERTIKAILIIFFLSIFLGWIIGLMFETSTRLSMFGVFVLLYLVWLCTDKYIAKIDQMYATRQSKAVQKEWEEWNRTHPALPPSEEGQRSTQAIRQLEEKYKKGEIDEEEYRRQYMFLIK